MPLYLLELTYRAYVEANDSEEAETEFTNYIVNTEDPNAKATLVNSVDELTGTDSEHDQLVYDRGYDGLWSEEVPDRTLGDVIKGK